MRRARSCFASSGANATREPSVALPPTTSMRSSTTPKSRCVSFCTTSTLWMRAGCRVRSQRWRRPPRRTSVCPSSRYQKRVHLIAVPTTARAPNAVEKKSGPRSPPRTRSTTRGIAKFPRMPEIQTAIAAGCRRSTSRRGRRRSVTARSVGSRRGRLRHFGFRQPSTAPREAIPPLPARGRGSARLFRRPCTPRAASARTRDRAVPGASRRTGSDRTG